MFTRYGRGQPEMSIKDEERDGNVHPWNRGAGREPIAGMTGVHQQSMPQFVPQPMPLPRELEREQECTRAVIYFLLQLPSHDARERVLMNAVERVSEHCPDSRPMSERQVMVIAKGVIAAVEEPPQEQHEEDV